MPPAPGWIETIAPSRSYSPPSITCNSWRSISPRAAVKRRLGLARRFGVVAALFFGHREEEPRLVERRAQPLEAGELFVDAVLFLERGLGGLGPIPEAGLAGLFQQFFVAGV